MVIPPSIIFGVLIDGTQPAITGFDPLNAIYLPHCSRWPVSRSRGFASISMVYQTESYLYYYQIDWTMLAEEQCLPDNESLSFIFLSPMAVVLLGSINQVVLITTRRHWSISLGKLVRLR